MPDVYYKKTIDFYHRGQMLHFHVAQDLFSSHKIDVGTARLLRSLLEDRTFHKILDLGCGYGPLGLTMQALNPGSEVHLVDRDALAVEYARQNACAHQNASAVAYGSLGYDDVPDRDFDLIISNIPGKAGETVIESLLLDAVHFLRPGGLVAVVVVTPLAELVSGVLATPGIDVVFQESRSGHAIFHYQFTDAYRDSAPPFEHGYDRGLYHRYAITTQIEDELTLTLPMQTARGLPEFDSLNYRTELLIEGLLKQSRLFEQQREGMDRALIFNPGQGYVPVVVWQMAQPRALHLVDRDLLSLRYAQFNLALSDCPAHAITASHCAGLPEMEPGVGTPFDLIAGTLREGEGPAAAESLAQQAATWLRAGGVLLIAAGSTPVTRLEKFVKARKQFRVEKRKRKKGQSLLVLRRI